MARINIIVALFFILFAIFVLVLSAGIPVSESQPLTMGTPMFPRMLSYGIIVLSTILIITNFHEARTEKKEDRKKMFEPGNIKMVGIGLSILFLSVVLMVFLGFIIAMVAMNVAFLFYFKVKNKIVLIVEPIVAPLLIYFMFQNVLNIPLPSGLLFY